MRDLLFKNLTSTDKKRKIIATTEVVDKEGVRSIIHRHFVYIVKEIKDNDTSKPSPYLYVLKDHNSLEQRERFFCKIKGGLFAVNKSKLFLIVFMHSLKICLSAIPEDSIKDF